MTENEGNSKAGPEKKKTLTLRGGGLSQGTVRQNFSHGRTKSVVVETRKRKIVKPGETAPAAAPEKKPVEAKEPPKPTGEAASNLSKSEVEARARALEKAKVRDVEDAKRREEEEKRQAEEDARRVKEKEEAARVKAEEDARLEAERQEAEREKAAEASAAVAKAEDVGVKPATREEPKPKELKPFERKKPEEPQKPSRPKGGEDRRKTKLTLSNALDEDSGSRGPSLAALRRRQEKQKRAAQQQAGPREKVSREVQLPETITIQELASRMSERSVDVIKYLMQQGQMMKPGDIIDADTAELIAEEFGHTVRRVSDADIEEGIFDTPDKDSELEPRPPIVTIMGHVDHGKTSLLDAIRNANVVSGEAGGITQHIGAYQVEHDGQLISFIDTPGHEAFTSMRARGAQITDIAILVVAADDSVMPQTIESISHAKAAEVPIIVAINKMDKPEADANKVKTELLQHEVFVEDMGGETQSVEVSALKGMNLDGLLEAIVLQAELLELRANPNRPGEGVVIEAKLDKGRGPVATVLVNRGTLNTGDIIIAGDEWGRVRALVNDRGEQVKEAGPSMPVEVLGLNGAPGAGDRLGVVENEARAREISEYRQRLTREKAVANSLDHVGLLNR